MTFTEWAVIALIAAMIWLAYISRGDEANNKDSCLSTGGKYVTEKIGSYPLIINKVVVMQPKYKRWCSYE